MGIPVGFCEGEAETLSPSLMAGLKSGRIKPRTFP